MNRSVYPAFARGAKSARYSGQAPPCRRRSRATDKHGPPPRGGTRTRIRVLLCSSVARHGSSRARALIRAPKRSLSKPHGRTTTKQTAWAS